jgi:hypothetical protein
VACVAVIASSIARLLQGDWSFVAIASGLLAADAGKDLVVLWGLPPADSAASGPAPEGVVTASQPNVQVVRVGSDPVGARVSLISPAPDPDPSLQPPNSRAG